MLQLLKYKKSLIIGAIGIVAYLTKPSKEKLLDTTPFANFNTISNDKILMSLIAPLIITSQDFIIFNTATLCYEQNTYKYIGIFNNWYMYGVKFDGTY